MALLLQHATRVAASSSRSEASSFQVRLRTVFVVLLGINAVLLFLLVRSPGRTEEERRDDISRLTAEQRAAQLQVQKFTQLRSKMQDAVHNEQEFAQANFLPRSTAFSQMLTDLERLATENQLQRGDITYTLNATDNQLGWVNVDVSLVVEGDYSNLVGFLNELEQSKLFWIVESLTVSGKAGQKLHLNLQAATYLLPS
ncbi:MAG: type 4a pilus biogenesis protein PilO [Acidobacteria bacterium]|nr:type 4a pilus biogenesis protein PilO [Acidobacteriota bacterium]